MSPAFASPRPAPWDQARKEDLSKVQGVCLDIDDTLSTDGKLTAGAFAALWALKHAGFAVIPVTGRPAGWCDHIARFWPVDAVVGENGAFTFFMEAGKAGSVRKRLDTPAGLSPDEAKGKLEALSKKIRKAFPHARWASDQAYREFDLAIDVCEDVPPWPQKDVDGLLGLCSREGAHAKLSSIHVNAWYGEYDKRAGLKNWLSQGGAGAPRWEELLFIGDSPNDEPLFESFEYSVGVANLKRYLDRLEHPPRWLTSAESGQGFEEMAARLIAARTGSNG